MSLSPAVAQNPAEAAASRRSGPVVAVIDIERAVEQYPRFIKMSNKLDEMRKALLAEDERMKMQLDELQSTIKVLPDDDPQRAQNEFQLKVDLQRREFRLTELRDRLQLEHLRMNLAVYEDVDYAITKVAKQKGVELVLRSHPAPPVKTPIDELKPRTVELLVNDYNRRVMWFASKRLDITTDVIKEMMVPLPPRNSKERLEMLGFPADQGDGKDGAAKPAGSGGE